MKKIIYAITAAILISSCGSASKVNRADQPWSYEIESVGVGVDGTYALRVWSYSRNPRIPIEIPKKNAIHATVFKGIPAGRGATSQPPMIASGSVSDTSFFFKNFFSSEYQRFINSVASGSVKTIKTGRKEYRIGYVISVAKDNLRKYLEEQGVIKSLSTGF